MSQETKTLSFEQAVAASPAQVYHAFTNSTALREWLCNSAQAAPTPGGRLYLWWNSGYYTAGEYTQVEPDRKVAFTWQGRREPSTTQVEVDIEGQESGSRVRLAHSGIGSGPEWEKPRDEIQKGWETGLENLAHVLGTGPDLRFIRRPMLGIYLSDYDAEIARHLGVPVTEGIRLDGTVEGMGAQAAGLQKDDVVVSMAGQPVIDFPSLTHALQGQYAGNEVEVVYYRGPEKRTASMKLSGRPMPPIPATPAELAETIHKLNEEEQAELERLFAEVTEEEASHSPEPGEWNAKEVLAHLIIGERGLGNYVSEVIAGQERWYDGTFGNSHEQTRAVVSAYPTVQELLEELKRNQAENVAFLGSLPQSFVERKGSYWRIAHDLVSPPSHTQIHIDQIRSAIASARKEGA